MSESNDLDPIGRLRAANPNPADAVPDASLARVSARVQEHIMSNEENATSRQAGRWRWVAVLGGAAVTGVLVIALAAGFFGSRQQPAVAVLPTATPVLAVVPAATPAGVPTLAPTLAPVPTAAPARTAAPTHAGAPTDEPVSPGDGGGM